MRRLGLGLGLGFRCRFRVRVRVSVMAWVLGLGFREVCVFFCFSFFKIFKKCCCKDCGDSAICQHGKTKRY